MSLSIYQIYRLFRRRFGYSFFNAFWLLSEISGWLGGWNVYLYRALPISLQNGFILSFG